MIWFNSRRPAPPRRTVLRLDCLEDRFAPAVISSLGQTFIDTAPAATFIASVVPADNAPLGFFHRFSQNGFVSGEMTDAALATPAPRPRPVLPPRETTTVLSQPLALPEILEAMPLPPASPVVAPPVNVEAPAQPPLLEVVPAGFTRTASAAPAAHEEEQEASFVIDDRLATAVFASDQDALTPAPGNSRTGLAAFGGLMAAASLLYLRSHRERRYEEFITYGQ